MSDGPEPTPPKPGGNKRRQLLIAIPVLLLLAGGGAAWRLMAARHVKPTPVAHINTPSTTPVYAELPDIIANLDSGSRRSSFIKLKVKLELAHEADRALVAAAMPRILDMFTTYLRDLHPDELRGSEGSYRLREAMLNRALVAAAPAAITDVLFEQMIMQ